jgi:hypothetical protein
MSNLKKFSTFLIFVMLTVAVSSTIWTDYRLINQEKAYATGTPVCTNPGLICHGCKDVYYCDEKNRPTFSQNCNKTQNCENGKCTNTPTFQCSPAGSKGFQCDMEGLFPDPGDCYKYHICVAEKDNSEKIKSNDERKCRNEYSYNPRTGYCDRKMTSPICTSYPVPLCTGPLQSGALKDNPSIYFLCQVYRPRPTPTTTTTSSTPGPTTTAGPEVEILYPYLRICENGRVYDPLIFKCK